MKIEEVLVPGYHRVAKATDEASGLKAIIAVHDVTLGPAVGGIRMWSYASENEALTDALRLSEGMTYKSAVADTGLGGGKSVIIGDSRTQKTPALLHAFGHFVNVFEGSYYPAEDVGTSVEDIVTVGETTKWVAGLPRDRGGSGDPSPFTALGTFLGMQACVEEVFGAPSFEGRSVVVQGIGHVGATLVRHLREAGAEVRIADLDQAAVQRLAAETGATPIATDAVLTAECDVYAPCALGATINDDSVPNLRCKIVAGAANNQLHHARHGQALKDRGILYAPDFVLNAGGIISVGVSLRPEGYDEALATERTENIRRAIQETIRIAKERDVPTSEAAMILARERLAAGPKKDS